MNIKAEVEQLISSEMALIETRQALDGNNANTGQDNHGQTLSM
ncbi:MAG: hypothetical protein AAGC65_01555 [Mucilaginibacter sp.]